jgi:hypothetical protein
MGDVGHLTMVRLLDAGLGLLATAIGAAAFRLWSWPALAGAPDASGLMAVIGWLVALLVGGLGLACLVAAARLGRGRGRMLQTFLACSLLLTFPIGTVFALYALWVCWAQPDCRRHLAPREPSPELRSPLRSGEPLLLKATPVP